MTGEWLFPDARPFWDTSRPDLPFADCNWHPTNESKEDETMTKTAAKTAKTAATKKETAVKKETTMTNEPKKSAYTLKKDAAAAFRAEYLDAVEDTEPLEGVTSCLPGKSIMNLTDDPAEQLLLAKAAAFFEMGTTFCTESQAKKFGGTLLEDEQGWLVNWKPKTSKDGNVSVWTAVVYPVDAFEWENGEPTFDEQLDAERKARRAKRAANRAQKALKEANAAAGITAKPKRRTTKAKVATTQPVAAPSADVAAMTATVNALMEQNAQLIAALTAALAK